MWEVREQGEDQRGTSRCPLEGDNGGKGCDGKIKGDFISSSEHYTLGITYNKVIFFQAAIYT